MTLTINLIKKNFNIGILIISNNENIKKTNWEISLKLKNFEIINFDNLNFNKDNDIYTITPKEWKINIEGNSQIISEFNYNSPDKNMDNFDYEIVNINDFNKFTPETAKGIEIRFINNTDKPIIINPQESYVFKI